MTRALPTAPACTAPTTARRYENAGHGLFRTHAGQLTADLREFIGAESGA
ncbi:hypothetical protein [Streptomyces sp. NPDC048277]